jgi:phosphatidylinositol-3-phosphatase
VTGARIIAAGALFATVAACGSTAQQPLESSPSSTATLIAQSPAARPEPHVMVIMDENRGVAATLGHCSSDPYLCSLAADDASLTAWYAITHPSAPNYLALVSGATQGITSDCSPDGGGCGPFNVPDLGGQLTGAGIPWVALMESMPAPCDRVSSAGEYAEKHDPFMYFDDDRGAGCATHIVPYPGVAALSVALDASTPPDFIWITPNLIHDTHDGTVAQGDAWFAANLPDVLSSSWFADDGTVIITFDENDEAPDGSCCGNAKGGVIPMIVISAKARGRGSIGTVGDDYSTLRAIEAAYGLPLLGNAASASPDLGGLFG